MRTADSLVKPSSLSIQVKSFFLSVTKVVLGLFWMAPLVFATNPTVVVLSPQPGSSAGSPIFYEAYAYNSTCANGISAMRIYSAPGVNAYTANGAHIEAFITLKAGTYSTVVQAWDNCGGVGKTTINLTVNSTAGVSVFLPAGKTPGIPVQVAASAQNPSCAAGISAIRIYTANGTSPYTINSNQLNTFVNLLPGTYDITVQAWDNCGHVYKSALTETATASADSYLYAVNSDNVSRFNISSGVLTNPNGSGNPPLFAAAKQALSIAVDPGGWFAWVFTTNGIYGYQIDQVTGNLWTMPGSPFPLNGTPISEPPGYLYPEPNAIAVDPNGNFLFVVYNVSNTVVSYQINRSTGAIKPEATVTGDGGMFGVTADFTGQYMYAINQDFDVVGTGNIVQVWGYKINQNNGALTAVSGSPYTIPNGGYYGGGVSSTMLPSASSPSVVLYANTEAPSNQWTGYAVNYGTGALTALPGSPYYADGSVYPIVADNHGKWVWGAGAFPSNPPEYFFNYAAIESNGSMNQAYLTSDISESNSGLTEDGNGQYLYAGGTNCPNGSCSDGVVTSWKVSTGSPESLTGPLVSPGGGVLAVGAAPKHGD